jgi:hypothetical protein
MNVSIHIERLIIDGLPVTACDNALVQAGVEAELSRLLSESGIPGELSMGGNWATVRAPTLRFSSVAHAGVTGADIGAGIYSAFGGLPNKQDGSGGRSSV